MIKRPHSCASDRPSSRLVMQRGTYESKQPRDAKGTGVDDGATTTPSPLFSSFLPATRAICYFALSATRSLIKCPPRVSFVHGIFQAQATTYDMPRLAAAVLHFFPPSPLFWPFSWSREPPPPLLSHSILSLRLASRTALRIQTFQDGPDDESESDGISSKVTLGLPGNSLLCKENLPRYANTILQGGIL